MVFVEAKLVVLACRHGVLFAACRFLKDFSGYIKTWIGRYFGSTGLLMVENVSKWYVRRF